MIDFFKRLLKKTRKKKDPQPLDDPRLYEMGSFWGDAIYFLDKPAFTVVDGRQVGRIYGFKVMIPRDGDLLKIPMQSGKSAIAVIHNVERKGDSRDMFFADFMLINYKSELPELMEKVEAAAKERDNSPVLRGMWRGQRSFGTEDLV